MEERVTKVGGYATSIVHRYLAARQKLAIFEGLMREDISKRFENSYGAHAYVSLRLTLLSDLVRDIWAFVLDSNKQSASVKSTWSQIQNDDLRHALRKIAITPPQGDVMFSGEWTEKQKAAFRDDSRREYEITRGRTFDETFERTGVQLPELLGSELAIRIASVRMKVIAHHDMKPTKDGPRRHEFSELGLKWSDPKDLLERLAPVL
jgi:hypothetical protein